MRWVICAAFMVALAPSAFAADLDILRGSQSVGPATFTRWSGFYAGGHYDYSSGNPDFSRATQPLLAFSLRQLTLEEQDQPSQWQVLSGNNAANASGFGGFAGYNTQWQDLILGIEADYTHAPFSAVASNTPIGRVVPAGSAVDSVNITASGSMSVTDFGSLRARAGYVFGNFLPYGFAGLALGRGSYNLATEVSGQQSTAAPPSVPCVENGTTCINFDYTNAAGKSSTLLYGFAVGGGFDMAVTQNIFLRAEYEFIQFAPVANITATISSARVGAGFKF